MIAAEFFAAADRLRFATVGEITQGRGLLVVAPHPDDESIGCGGLIAEACALRLSVRLVIVSDGAGSHPHSKTYPAPRLRALRETETIAAAAGLGLAAEAVTFLRLPDRFVPTTGPVADEARRDIIAAAHAIDAGAVCATWGRDPHCDHVATAQLVDDCRPHLGDARILFYPVWGWTLSPDRDAGPAPCGFRFDAGRHLETKAAAIAAHRSQTANLITDDPDGFRLTPELIEILARPHEIFLADSGLVRP